MRMREIERIITDDGWYLVRGKKGSHKQYKHDVKKGKVTIPSHSGDLPPGTICNILRQAGLK